MAGANDSVSLPVAKATLAGDDLWTLLNAGAVGNLAPSDVSAITLALLLLATQMAMQRAATPFVGIDVQIDAFMAHGGLFLALQTSGDLFRTPLLAQEPFDLLPSLPGNACTICIALPVEGEFIRLVGAIALLPAIAAQLARDRALMATDQDGDASLVMSGFHQSVYLVSLFAGKLCVAHLCASLTWRLEKHAYAIAACLQPLISKLHFNLNPPFVICGRAKYGVCRDDHWMVRLISKTKWQMINGK